MATTNYAALTSEQKKVWARDIWKAARDYMFLNRFLGEGQTAMIQRISELTKTEKGDQAIITLVADLEGDGVAGDRTLEGNEEAGKSYDQKIRIDLLRHAVRHEGRMAERFASINDLAIAPADRLFHWPQGPRPADHPGLSELGL